MSVPDPAVAPAGGLRKASLGTLFLTIFLDLLGFGLVIPFLPGIARRLGAGDFVATLPGAVFSIMQFVFIPIWGRLSDRVGRRPVLLWSIAASAIGMAILGFAPTLVWLFVARLWSGGFARGPHHLHGWAGSHGGPVPGWFSLSREL